MFIDKCLNCVDNGNIKEFGQPGIKNFVNVVAMIIKTSIILLQRFIVMCIVLLKIITTVQLKVNLMKNTVMLTYFLFHVYSRKCCYKTKE